MHCHARNIFSVKEISSWLSAVFTDKVGAVAGGKMWTADRQRGKMRTKFADPVHILPLHAGFGIVRSPHFTPGFFHTRNTNIWGYRPLFRTPLFRQPLFRQYQCYLFGKINFFFFFCEL